MNAVCIVIGTSPYLDVIAMYLYTHCVPKSSTPSLIDNFVSV